MCTSRPPPPEFQEGVVSRDELNALQADPPEWLRELRRNGPHPRPVVAAKLGVSISGLARGGSHRGPHHRADRRAEGGEARVAQQERATQAEVRKEAARLKEEAREE